VNPNTTLCFVQEGRRNFDKTVPENGENDGKELSILFCVTLKSYDVRVTMVEDGI